MSASKPTVSPLTLLPGGGSASSRSKVPLRVISSPRPMEPRQLELPGMLAEPHRLVSVGYDALDFEALLRILRDEGIRRIADIRVSPSFFGRGFSVDGVSAALDELGIQYEHWEPLTNRFIGQSWDQQVVLRRFAEHVQGATEALQHLREKVKEGPVLLLGRAPSHAQSEREVVVEALLGLDEPFTLRIIDLDPK
jgi:hypothetical protein